MNYENLTKETLPVEFQNRIERFNRLFSAATDHTFEEDDLFEYEMLCIKLALSFSEFFQDFGDEQYQDFLKQYESLYDLVDAIKDKLQFFDNGHTGNSMSMSWLLFRTYRERPELVPYMHGCLAQLVGDEGYYDDRSDVPEL